MEHMRMKCMKKALSPLIIGCLACAIVVAPETAFDDGLASMVWWSLAGRSGRRRQWRHWHW
jgi:hypothetical protein